jgi:hypothetical protein
MAEDRIAQVSILIDAHASPVTQESLAKCTATGKKQRMQGLCLNPESWLINCEQADLIDITDILDDPHSILQKILPLNTNFLAMIYIFYKWNLMHVLYMLNSIS